MENFLLANARYTGKHGDKLVQPLSFEHGLYRQLSQKRSGD
jgi:hypothetical protein